jgi:hypothetical protein
MEKTLGVGSSICYIDYLGYQRFGKIGWLEPYKDDIYWVFIVDDDDDYNAHQVQVTTLSGEGKIINYAEIRLSDEVWEDK